MSRRPHLLSPGCIGTLEPRGECRFTGIESGQVHWTDASGTPHAAEAHRVIVTHAARPDTSLIDALLQLGIAATGMGDSREVASVEGAMHDATQAVLGL